MASRLLLHKGQPGLQWLASGASPYLLEELPPSPPVEAAFVMVEAASPRGRLVALTESTVRGWDLPGGYREEEEAPQAAALRELHEETGLQLEEEALSLHRCLLVESHLPGVAPTLLAYYRARVAVALPLDAPSPRHHASWWPVEEVPALCGRKWWPPYLL